MTLADGARHVVQGSLKTYILVILCAGMLPFVFTAIDTAPAGVIVAPSIVKLFLGCIVAAFVIGKVIMPLFETVKQPPRQEQGYNQFQQYPGQPPSGGF